MENYIQIKLYLDNDTTGQNCSCYVLSQSYKCIDESDLYKNYKEVGKSGFKTTEKN
jgi:hypothetical protein